MMYGPFATVYDALMADVDYGAWASFYRTMAECAGLSVRSAVDCACGTGSMTLALYAQGIRMTGADRSEEMLRIAAERARHAGAQVPFILQDMRSLALHRPVDAVFCACDGVNYLTRPKDVQAFFGAAYQALRPGGGLLFDISTEYKLANRLGNNCLGEDGKAVSYIWQNHYDASARRLQMDLTFFLREDDGRYRRFQETHVQRAHTVRELEGWLAQAGFMGIRAYGDRCLSAPAADSERVHLVAVRRET